MPITPEQARVAVSGSIDELRQAYYPIIDEWLTKHMLLDDWEEDDSNFICPEDMPIWFKKYIEEEYGEAGWLVDIDWPEDKKITFEPNR